MNGGRKSDRSVVPEKPPNKGPGAPVPAEEVEGRGLAKGNPLQLTRSRTLSRAGLRSAQKRIRQAAKRGKKRGERLTALWHHVYSFERLREAYHGLKRQASAGVDGVSWAQYGENLQENLQDLSGRLQRGAYRARPVVRVRIPKGDGGERPIGIPTLEDKIVQRSFAEVVGSVSEEEFLGFSYAYRAGRSQHHALDALAVGIERRKVNWVLDADIRGFFDAIDHEWMVKFVEHRIADQRVIRHVKKWLRAGVLEEGRRVVSREGTPQGGSASPLLANIYLHYVFDLWAQSWRKHARGDVILVRYADDIRVGFQFKEEADRFLVELEERFRRFRLELNAEKTRLIEFGRFAAERRLERGQGKPATFDFLGFTHVCGTDRKGRFVVLRRTMKKRLRGKLKTVALELRRRRHEPVPELCRWLASVVEGHFNYYGVPRNYRALAGFRERAIRHLHRALRRRSQKDRTSWSRTRALANRYIARPTIRHPYPNQRLRVST